MADVFTGTSALSNVVAASVDQYIRAELRHMPQFRNLVDTRPVTVDKPGSSVALYTRADLAVATTPLNELTDPDAVALPNPTSITLTPNEYGNVSITSLKVGFQSFMDVDPDQRDAIMWNMYDTIDTLVRDKASTGTNVVYGGVRTATNQVTGQDVLTAAKVRTIVAGLRTNAAVGKRGDLYAAYIHPHVSVDLRTETGAAAWRSDHQYAAPGLFWPGEIGVYEGAFFIESGRCKIDTTGGADGTDAGSGVDPVYHTIFAGRDALAEGVQIEPHVEIGVVPDKLNRFHPLGWYGLLGWAVFRQKALYRAETGSSLAANT